MILLDTTVLVYATGGDHPLRSPSRTLVSAIGDGSVDASTTHEVIQEFVHVRARRTTRREAVQLAGDLQDLLAPLVGVTETHLRSGLAIWERHDQLGSFDAILAAVAIAHDCSLVSADKAFATVRGLDHVVPDASGVDALIER